MSNGTNTVVVQAHTTGANSPTGSSWSAAATAQIGAGDNGCNSGSTFPTHSPAFDNTYYTTPGSGHLWACGAQSSSSSPELYSIPFTGTGTFGTPVGSGSALKVTNHAQCSPLTEIDNGSTDYLFLGEGLTGSFGYLYGFTVSGTTPTAITNSPITSYPNASGGTSGIIIDNVSAGAQASSIYFTALATSTTVCGSISAYCAIKLTQAGLQ